MAGFAAEVAKWVMQSQGNISQVVRKVVIEAGRRIILKTPVDTGRARNSWQIGVGAPKNWEPSGEDPSGAATIHRLTLDVLDIPNAQILAGTAIYFTSACPYMVKLEYGLYPPGPKTVNGYSTQAPRGMVRTTAEEMEGVISVVR